jgi:hypothetical protein
VRVYIHRGECSYVYEYLRLYCVSKKKCWLLFFPTYIFYPTTVAAAKSELSYFLVQENEGNMVKNAQVEDDLRLDSSAYSHHLF